MIITLEDGTMQCGPLDVVCILHDANTNRYHAAFFEERPFPGPVEPVDNVEVVRLKSKMHHTGGADTIKDAEKHMTDLAEKLGVPAANVWPEPREWDGEIGIVWTVSNWTR